MKADTEPAAAVVRSVRTQTVAGGLHAALELAGLAIAAPDGSTDAAVILAAMSPPVPVQHQLVEALVDLLYDSGWPHVIVAGAVRVRDRDRGLNDFADLAAHADLRGSTQRGNPYRLVDLYDDLATVAVPEASVLSGQLISTAWANAGLRIVVARNVTDLADGYLGCIDELLAVAYPVAGASVGDVAADLLSHLPPHSAVVDAIISSHGYSGSAVPRLLETETLLVADDALLADVLAARLQGVDPAVSRPVAAALARRGLPSTQNVAGDLTPWAGWQASPALARDAIQRAGTSAERLTSAVLAPVDGSASDAIVTGLQRAAAPYAGHLDTPGVREWADWTTAWAGYSLAAAAQQTRAWAALFAADRIDRVEVPLGFDPDDYTADFASVAADASGFERLLDGAPETDNGMRWATVDGAVVFQVSRVVRAPFAAFVEHVDVAGGISLMADYIGGRVVVLDKDDSGRPTRQAERNIYLTQPNYLALWGGLPIDVCKIETVSYSDAEHRLAWRTVSSPNGSATYDDGRMTFADAGEGLTRLSVSGRQLFTLPPFWQAVDLDRFPAYKALLVEDAYRRFFEATFDNLEACFEGRDFRIGRAPADPMRPLPTEVVATLVSSAAKRLTTSEQGGPAADATDTDGFRHFSGAAPAAAAAAAPTASWARGLQDLASEYYSAAAADWTKLIQP